MPVSMREFSDHMHARKCAEEMRKDGFNDSTAQIMLTIWWRTK